MKINIRYATLEDAVAMVEIKNQLSFKNVNGTTTTGGFLLGTSLPTYQEYIANDYCLVAENENQIIGFGIILKNTTLQQSDIWTKRHAANWEVDITKYESPNVCYFEQLAFLQGYTRVVIRLCYQLLRLAFNTHDNLFATTVSSPIMNLAAIPFIEKAGGRKIGRINEVYPEIGHILSDIYLIEKDIYLNRLQHSGLKPLLNRVQYELHII